MFFYAVKGVSLYSVIQRHLNQSNSGTGTFRFLIVYLFKQELFRFEEINHIKIMSGSEPSMLRSFGSDRKSQMNTSHVSDTYAYTTWHVRHDTYSLHDSPTASSLTWLPFASGEHSMYRYAYAHMNNKTPCDLNHVMYHYCVPAAHHRRLCEPGLVDICSNVVSGRTDRKLLGSVVRCDTGRMWPNTSHVCEPCPSLQVLVPAGHRWHGVPELVHHRWMGISYLHVVLEWYWCGCRST